MYLFSREARIRLNSLPMVDVKAIGRKFAGLVGSPLLCMRRRLPLHHEAGAQGLFSRIFEKRVARK